MGNVLVRESSLQAIADAIREKNSSVNIYTPGEMADAVAAIAPVLLEKVVTENGVYSAASEGADGYSEVSVNVSIWIAPYAYDVDTGYANNGVWTPGGAQLTTPMYTAFRRDTATSLCWAVWLALAFAACFLWKIRCMLLQKSRA